MIQPTLEIHRQFEHLPRYREMNKTPWSLNPIGPSDQTAQHLTPKNDPTNLSDPKQVELLNTQSPLEIGVARSQNGYVHGLGAHLRFGGVTNEGVDEGHEAVGGGG
jgi:hypothetical protein